MSYTIDLSDKVAIVTGSAKGIGLATSKVLTEAGAQVVMNDISEIDKAAIAIDEVGRLGKKPFYLQKDISAELNTTEMAEQVLDKFGRIDFLVNNAGVVADWDKSYAVHVKGLYYCSEAVIPSMKAQGEGRIINISSTCVFTGGTGIPQYVATKAGAFSLTRYLAKTYAPFGILTNGIMPAVVMSDMIMTRYTSEEEMVEHYIPQMPIRRIGYPVDIANIVLFLCSELSSFICGEIIVADGGRMNVG